MCNRNEIGLNKLIDLSKEHILERFTDEKNIKKGSWLGIEPLKMYRYIQHEALECIQAYREDEGIERELEELGDVILFCLMRVHQIKSNY